MADIIDDAQATEVLDRLQALARVPGLGTGEAQLVIEGAVCCLECEEPIPLARLAAVPGCVRCAECQEEAEGL
ncbi:transcriptional regulator, TraR/DksA family [Humidesulfovibrio mexicanus]|uniref:Transcriptional regulator, TraR/DksA family n=1 Tax=Humidesulfovibrio mexicanus TaxID=147047 RepID=A0A239C7K3_9BACT|nr:TraR/DksA C4-type zinc finger protein [Humidesulfovibrio mexicanus]SNS16090.1 transcriptional regulator, TraR/DksA family [Humidesulfovibrio mexicanus]